MPQIAHAKHVNNAAYSGQSDHGLDGDDERSNSIIGRQLALASIRSASCLAQVLSSQHRPGLELPRQTRCSPLCIVPSPLVGQSTTQQRRVQEADGACRGVHPELCTFQTLERLITVGAPCPGSCQTGRRMTCRSLIRAACHPADAPALPATSPSYGISTHPA